MKLRPPAYDESLYSNYSSLENSLFKDDWWSQLCKAEVIDLLMLIHGFKLEEYSSKQYLIVLS